MNWQPIYALLIFASTLVTYLCAIKISQTEEKDHRKAYLIISLIINFSILFLYKYYDFFNDSVFQVLNYFGLHLKFPDFNFLLPVGISFYTFQAVGYTIDVYRGDIAPEKHFGIYALFVSFFPQLVAGPIERAKNLLPQFRIPHAFDYPKAVEGMKLIIWGYFMKTVVADRLSMYVDVIYNNVEQHSSVSLIVATIFFAIQIYCDFAGYSNIAIGCAKVMGFDLMTNFRRPYFAQSCTEFWQRWHISLSTWFKDYVYIPLGGNRISTPRTYLNLFITFLVSGLWHGANWTFVIWGGLNGIYQIIYKWMGFQAVKNDHSFFAYLRKSINILLTFILICFSWIFFRANSLSDSIMVMDRIFSSSGGLFIGQIGSFIYGVLGIIILMSKDIWDEFFPDKVLFLNSSYKPVRYLSYSFLTILILLIGVFDGGQFIYFQF